MEKTNWIEKIKEVVRVAMNKGKNIVAYYDDNLFMAGFYVEIGNNNTISIDFFEGGMDIRTQNGCLQVDYNLTDRDKLELQTLALHIKEYKEDMAISELKEFISEKEKGKIADINDLDDDDKE